MKADKLASFRIDSELWQQFQAIARDSDTTASALLVGFVQSVVNTGNVNTSIQDIDNTSNQSIQSSIQDIDSCIDNRITESIQHGEIGEKIDKSYTAMIGQFNGLLDRFEELEKKLIA